MKRARAIKDEVLYLAFLIFRALVGILPETWGYWFGRRLGDLCYRVLKERRRVALDNIKSALNLGEGEAERLAAASFRNLCLLGVELLRFAGRPRVIRKRIAFRGEEHLRRALAEGKGVVLLPSHFGNWELLGQALGVAGYRVHPIVLPQANDRFYAVVDRLRRRAGLLPIERGFALREIFKALRAGDCVSIIPDQDAGRGGVFVPFFGRPASTPQGVISIPRATGAPVVPIFIRRVRPGYHEINCHPALSLVETGDAQADLEANLLQVNRLLEQVIAAHPEQWLWMHKRWKTKPRRGGKLA